VLRAATMGWLGILGTVTGRERAALRTLAGTVLILVLLDPSLARSLGFALSVAASAGLLVLSPPWRRRLARTLPGWAADAIATPLAAQVACAPLLAAAFGRVSLVAVPANVVAAPAVPPATVAGVVAAALAPVSRPLARAAAWLAGIPTGWLVHVARDGARLPAAQLGTPLGPAGAATVSALLLGCALLLRRRTGRALAATVTVALLAGGTAVQQLAPGWPQPGWRLVACDVGQGDALVVRTTGGAVLVDTGPDPGAVDRCLRDLRVRRLAAVVLTHFHADHVEGLPGALRGRRVRDVVAGPLDEPPEERARVLRWAAARHLAVRVAALGERWTVGDATFDVLGPETAFHGTDSDPNNSSLVLRLTTPGLVLLLTGDIEEPAQLATLARGPVGHADVLKVPHHGSARQTAQFIAATGATAAIVSVGRDNPYGHPAPSTLDALASAGMRTFRTDRDGDVAVARVAGRLRVAGRHGRGRPPAVPAPPTQAERAISWRRAAEPGSWCPIGPGTSAPRASTGVAKPGRRTASAISTGAAKPGRNTAPATAAATHRTARAPPPGTRPAVPDRAVRARPRSRRGILPPCPPQPRPPR
jgi:competence protein ComEC